MWGCENVGGGEIFQLIQFALRLFCMRPCLAWLVVIKVFIRCVGLLGSGSLGTLGFVLAFEDVRFGFLIDFGAIGDFASSVGAML